MSHQHKVSGTKEHPLMLTLLTLSTKVQVWIAVFLAAAGGTAAVVSRRSSCPYHLERA